VKSAAKRTPAKHTPAQKRKPSKARAASLVTTASPAPVHVIEDIAELRALAHPLRFQILRTLYIESPLSATQLGKKLGEGVTKLHYHLTEMEKFKLIRVAAIETKRNISEKKFIASAPWIRISPALLVHKAETTNVIHQAIDAIVTRTALDVDKLFAQNEIAAIEDILYMHAGYLLEPADVESFRRRLRELLMEFREKQVTSGKRFAVTVVAFPEPQP
jgi:predicted transcriptional regulator